MPDGYSTPEHLEIRDWDKLDRSQKYHELHKVFKLIKNDCERCCAQHGDNPYCSVALRDLQGGLELIGIIIDDNKHSHSTPDEIYRKLLDLNAELRAIAEKYSSKTSKV